MGWFQRERRGPAWKQGWTEQTLSSISTPPLPLLAIFGIMALLLWFSSYSTYKAEMQKSMINFKLFLLLLPLILIFVANSITKYGRLVVVPPRTKNEVVRDAADSASPWGVVVLLIVLLVLLSYQSYFHSKWSPPIWWSY